MKGCYHFVYISVMTNFHCLFFLFSFLSRFKLPCLLQACKVTRQQLKCESQEDDGTDDGVATDLDKLEENLWRDNGKDDFRSDFQTRKDRGGERNCLNDDDIEEIMIFQTQSLKRKESEDCEKFVDRQSPHPPRLAREEGILSIGVMSNALQERRGDSLGNHSSSSLVEKTKEKLLTCFGEEELSCNPTKKGHLSHNPAEKGNLSHNSGRKGNVTYNPAEDGNLLCDPVGLINLLHNPVAEGNLSRNPIATVNLSLHVGTDTLLGNSDEYQESTLPCGHIEGKEKEELVVPHEERNVNEEELLEENEWLSPRDEHMTEKELQQVYSLDKTPEKKQGSLADFENKIEILRCDERGVSSDGQERETTRSHSSSSEWACVEINSDSDDMDVQPLDQVQGDSERYALERQLGRRDEGQNCHVNEELSDVDEADGKDFVTENNADFTDASIDLLNDDPAEVNDDNVNKLDEVDGIQETFSDFQPLENDTLDLPFLGSYKETEGFPLPLGEERWDDEQDLQGSPREVTLLNDDDVDETDVNESITLISDHDEEVCVVVFYALMSSIDLFV